jgi:hypothetical protein
MTLEQETQEWLNSIGLQDYSPHSASAGGADVLFTKLNSAAIRVFVNDNGEKRMKIYENVPFKFFLTLTTGDMQYKHKDTKRIVEIINHYGQLAEWYPPF